MHGLQGEQFPDLQGVRGGMPIDPLHADVLFAGRQRHHGARGSIGITVAVGMIGVKQKDRIPPPLLERLVEGHAGELMIQMGVQSWIGHHHDPRVHLAQHLDQVLH